VAARACSFFPDLLLLLLPTHVGGNYREVMREGMR
jgi:hypothetical protein